MITEILLNQMLSLRRQGFILIEKLYTDIKIFKKKYTTELNQLDHVLMQVQFGVRFM